MTEYILSAKKLRPTPSASPIEGGAVRVVDDKIAEVGFARDLVDRAGPDIEVRDFPAATVIPGLIDAHAFLSLDAGQDSTRRYGHHPGTEAEDMLVRAAALLRAGVTTVRDLGTPSELMTRFRQLAAPGTATPRVLSSGAPVTRPRGEAAFFGGAVAGAPFEAVAPRLDAGADLIHVIASGGHLSPDSPPYWEPQFSTDELSYLVEAAHDAGLPVVASAHASDGIAAAVEAGADEVHHATWATGPKQVEFDESVAKAMSGRSAVCMPHGANWRRVVANMGAERAFENFYGKLAWLSQLDVPLLSGSRAGTSNAPFNDPVPALEAPLWAGVNIENVLEASTSGAAEVLGLGAVTGRIVEGLSADLLVVDGDPLEDGLEALRRPVGVVTAGTFV